MRFILHRNSFEYVYLMCKIMAFSTELVIISPTDTHVFLLLVSSSDVCALIYFPHWFYTRYMHKIMGD